MDRGSIYYFFKEPANSIDVAYIGASNVYVHFNSTLAYNLYGFTTGELASSGQPFAAIRYLIEETRKHQNPVLYVIDITRILDDVKTIPDGTVRITTDSMNFSRNRIDLINKLLSYKDTDKKEYINFYFSFFLYHNRWKNIESESNYKESNFFKGFLMFPNTIRIKAQEECNWNDQMGNLPEENTEMLLDLINYIKSNNLNALFVIPKRGFSEKEIKTLNIATKIIEENELNMLNFNLLEDLNINFEEDFYNREHLNIYGATKYTVYFSKYLKENYNLQDHRNDKAYDSWKSEYERFKICFKNLTGKNFDDLLQED